MQAGSEEIAAFLLHKGTRVDVKDREGNTPLHYAVSFDYTNLINLLVESGARGVGMNHAGRSPWEGL